MTTLQEKIAVMQAAACGEKIEYQPRGTASSTWRDLQISGEECVWDWDSYTFRIKPKPPREFWIVKIRDAERRTEHVCHHKETAQQLARSHPADLGWTTEVIHVKEHFEEV